MTEKEFLSNYSISNFERPSLAVDIALFALQREDKDVRTLDVSGIQILLIKRAGHPYMDRWSLPGGFCKSTESVEETARRELREETGVEETFLKLTGSYSTLGRDPRGWIISNTFTGMVDKSACHIRTDEEAWEADWFTISELTESRRDISENEYELHYHMTLVRNHDGDNRGHTEDKSTEVKEEILESDFCVHCKMHGTYVEHASHLIQSDLAFDHGLLIGESYLNLKREIRTDIRNIFNFFPDKFVLGEVRKAYEIVFKMSDTNFRRMVKPYVVETEENAPRMGHRPAKYYVRNTEAFL